MADSQNVEMTEKVTKTIDTTLCGLALAMAYQVGIIQTLTETEKPRTSQEIADAKNLKERYVREILNSLVCSHFIQVQKKDGSLLYHIPKDQWSAFDISHLAFLGITASAAVRFQDLVQCFQKDGPYGLPYGEAPITMDAIAVINEGRVDTEIQLMVDCVPGLKEKLESGIEVIEVGSGKGVLISKFAGCFPNSRFTASDYSKYVVEQVQQSITSQNLQNLSVERLDILNIPDSHVSKYDFAFVSDVIHDLPDPDGGLAGLHKVLKPGSYLGMVEVGLSSDVAVNSKQPGTGGVYSISAFHCVPQAYQSASSKVLGCCWGREVATQYLERQGFKVLDQQLYAGIFVLFVCQKK